MASTAYRGHIQRQDRRATQEIVPQAVMIPPVLPRSFSLPLIPPTYSPTAATQHTVWRNRPVTTRVLFSPAPFLDYPPPDKAILTARTQMCVDHFLPRGCRRGKHCRHAHHESELLMPAVDPRYKTKWCRRMLDTGFCCFGEACLFIHNEDWARMDAKVAWMRGGTLTGGLLAIGYGDQRGEQSGRGGTGGIDSENVGNGGAEVKTSDKKSHPSRVLRTSLCLNDKLTASDPTRKWP